MLVLLLRHSDPDIGYEEMISYSTIHIYDINTIHTAFAFVRVDIADRSSGLMLIGIATRRQ